MTLRSRFVTQVARVDEGEDQGDSDSVIQRLVDSHDNEYILSKPHEGLSQVRCLHPYTLHRTSTPISSPWRCYCHPSRHL